MKIREWWDRIEEEGPKCGYYPNPSKSWLIVKESLLQQAKEVFEGPGVKVSASRRQYLEIPIGTHTFIEEFM